MPGGPRGPVPKRESQRRGHTKPALRADTVQAEGGVEVPPPDDDWHEVARAWYDSLSRSGQSQFYEPSDWQAARFVAEVMTRNLAGKQFNGNLFAAVWSAMGELLSTEGARRRVRLEVERSREDPDEEAAVAAVHEIRQQRSRAN